jgi:hypothetical protein
MCYFQSMPDGCNWKPLLRRTRDKFQLVNNREKANSWGCGWVLEVPLLYARHFSFSAYGHIRIGYHSQFHRSKWSRGLRRGSATARLLGLRVQIPPGTWMSVTCECCVLSGRGLFLGLITRPESPTECGVSECDGKVSIMKSPWPTRDLTICFGKKIPCLLFLKCNQTSQNLAFSLHDTNTCLT